MPALEAPEEPAASPERDAREEDRAIVDPAKPVHDTKDSKVPLGALHSERERRKAAERALADRDQVIARSDERLKLLAAAIEEAAKPPPSPPAAAATPPPIPDWDADPSGHIQARFNALEGENRGLREMLGQHGQSFQQMDHARREAEATQQLAQWTLAQERELAASNPEYDPARQHLIQMRHAELQAMGITDPAARQQIIANDVLTLAKQAATQRGNFAQMVLGLAKARGFAMPAAAAPPDPAPSAAADPTPTSREAAQERGREMAISLGSAGGAPRGALTADALARMGDADFESVLAKARKDPSAMRALFGS